MNPPNETHRPLSDFITKEYAGKYPRITNLEYHDGGTLPAIGVSDVKPGELHITTHERYLTQQAIDDYRMQLVPADSLVVTMRGSYPGRAAVTTQPTYILSSLRAYTLTEDLSPAYAAMCINAITIPARGLHVPGITTGQVRAVRIPYHSPIRQTAYVLQALAASEAATRTAQLYTQLQEKYADLMTWITTEPQRT